LYHILFHRGYLITAVLPFVLLKKWRISANVTEITVLRAYPLPLGKAAFPPWAEREIQDRGDVHATSAPLRFFARGMVGNFGRDYVGTLGSVLFPLVPFCSAQGGVDGG
jgi:hypothetical protein